MPAAVASAAALATALFCFNFAVADGDTRPLCPEPANFKSSISEKLVEVERAPFGTFNVTGKWSYLVPRYPKDVNATFVILRKGRKPLEYRVGDGVEFFAQLRGKNITIFSHDLPLATPEVNDLIEQLLQLEDNTVIHLRWNVADCDVKGKPVGDFYYCPGGSSRDSDLYQQAAGDSRLVARQAERFLSSLLSVSDSDSLDNVHFIGFGIGAHVGAFLAEELSFTDVSLGRLTALDPTLFLFQDLTPLSRDSAGFVDVVHTSSCLGMTQPLGHIDFYVNKGDTQPGCSTHMCSHVRALTLYATSIAKCGVLRHAVPMDATSNNEGRVSVAFGHWCDRGNATGPFRIETEQKYPYCSALSGSRHVKVHSSPANSAPCLDCTLTSVLLVVSVITVHSDR